MCHLFRKIYPLMSANLLTGCAVIILVGLNATSLTAAGGQAVAENKSVSESQASVTALRIDSGDLLEITVYGVPDLTQKSRVNSTGEITLPLLGPVHVRGLTAAEVEGLLGKKLVEARLVKKPSVTVFISEYATQGITVFGEVNKPGTYSILGSRRLFDVISMAGGLTAKSGKQVTITHRNELNHPVIITLPSDLDELSQSDLEILPGDTIVVSKAGIVYVVGGVGKPGGFPIDNHAGLTVVQAIALAEGTKLNARLDNTRLIRTTAEGRKEIFIPLGKILAGQASDSQLQANDIVFVPNSAVKSGLKRGLEVAVQMATGVAIYRF